MKYKILLSNIAYFSGWNGSIREYIFKSYRHILPSKKRIGQIINEFKDIVAAEKPDLICLVEIRKKQIEMLTDKEYKFYEVETKYAPGGLARKVPIIRKQGNGFISREKINFKKFFIKSGVKRLVYILDLPGGIKLILFHFALARNTRKKQFKEIADIARGMKSLIICGDFNIFKGISEIEPLIKDLDLNLCQKEPTIPAFRPKMPFDLFLVSKNIKTESKVIQSQISDHLPVVLEIDI